MITVSTPKNGPRRAAKSSAENSSNDLRFIADLGRSLLHTVHPKKVAARIAEALQQRVDALLCMFVAEIDTVGHVSCVYSKSGIIDTALLRKQHFDKWLSFMPPQIGYTQTDQEDLFIDGHVHKIEYVSPLHINNGIKGAIVVAFESPDDLNEKTVQLIDAVTQMAAMSINLSAHFELALHNSISEAREENRKFTEAVLDALPVSLYVVDRDYRIVTWNRHREVGDQGIPRNMAIGRNVFEVLAKYPQGRLREEFERAFRTGNIERIEQQTTDEGGATRHWMVSKVPMRDGRAGEVSHVITVGEDVTARVEAVRAVSRAEKLAAVGRLAAGVVHEINNPLATIAACAEALEQRVGEGAFEMSDSADDLAEYLGLIKNEAFRCKTITVDLLDFSRVRAGDRSHVDLGEIVRSASNLISHQKRGSNITQNIQIEPGLAPANADAGQIQQAVIALATNAIDAMPDGGQLTFRVFARGDRLVIDVEDTGLGISQENMPKIFEPFFTTKDVGKGTGLGLSVCYGIISEHGGRISVRSSVNKGTTFSIFLPSVK